MPNFLQVSSLICIFLAFGLTACDSGGGMEGDPQPGEVETTVEGTVTNSESGSAIDGAEVAVFHPDEDEQLGQATTDTTGSYEVSFTLPENDTPDQLVIEADAEDFVAQSDTVDFEQSLTQDFSLEVTIMEATASGKVRNEENAEGIEGASVTGTSDDGNTLFETTTDAAGEYQKTFDLSSQPDEVTITADAEDFEPADTTVGFAEEINADFDLEVGTTESTISGTVTDAETEESIDGAIVTGARPGEGEQFFETQSGSDGEYEATFEVKATNEPSNVALTTQADGYETREDTASFSEEISKDVELTAETTESTASGTVTRTDTGDPVDGATVTGSAGDSELFEASTDENGQYEATFEVRVFNEPDQILIEADDSDFDPAEQTVAFASEITTDLSLEPIQVDVVVDGTILAEQDESSVEGADVSVFQPSVDDPLASTTSGSGGTYELSFSALAPDAPDSLRLEAAERRFADTSLTVGFSELITRDIELPSIELSTIEELQAIQTDSDFPLDGYYVQTADIDASEATSWEPIGDSEIPFGGKLDGNGFKITGLTINRESEDDVALIRHASGESVLESVVLKNVDINGLDGVAGLVATDIGPNSDGPTIRNSKVTGNISGVVGVAGLISNSRSAEIRNSVFSGTLRGGGGGLVSRNRGTDIYDSESHGSIITDRGAGGLVFSLKNAVIEDSKSTMDITVADPASYLSNGLLGGLAGLASSNSTIRRSFSGGDIEGETGFTGGAGGLVGKAEFEAEIYRSYATGSVSGAENIGGIAGSTEDDAQVTESYSASSVSQGEDIGGIVGVNGGEISETFWDIDVSGQTDGVGRGSPDGTTGLTTDEMQGESAEENMDGLDFEETWQVVTGDYPALFWEDI